MIIELHSSLVFMARASTESLQLVIEKLELLWIAHREGHHILFSEIDTAENLLITIGPKSSSAASLLKRLINQYPKIASLAYYVHRKLLVGNFEQGTLQLVGNSIQCSLSLINSNMIQKTVLLVENLSDADFYGWITKVTHKKSEFGTVSIEFEGYPGGGDTTADAYINIKRKTSRLCLCIVDSDMRAPALEAGTTAKKVIRDDIQNPLPRSSAHVIGACSIENLIPFSAYEHVWKADVELVARLNIYKEHYREGHWKYLQLKKHITCFETHGKGEFSNYWHSALKGAENGCTNKICKSKRDCEVHKLVQLSSSPLKATFTYLLSMSVDMPELLPDIREAWDNIAKEILNWCCAPAPSAVA
jgi:hypothetical protein